MKYAYLILPVLIISILSFITIGSTAAMICEGELIPMYLPINTLNIIMIVIIIKQTCAMRKLRKNLK